MSNSDLIHQYYLLKNFGWLTKIKFSNIPNKEAKFNHRFNKYLTYSDIFNMIMEISVDLKDAYDWKEDYIRFNKNSTIKNAPENFNDLICKLQKLNISFMNPIVSSLIKWKKEILNSFIRYDKRYSDQTVILEFHKKEGIDFINYI